MMIPGAQGMGGAGLAFDIGQQPESLKSACKVMEQQFANQLFASMRKSMVPADGAKGHVGFAKSTAYSMFDGQMAQTLTEGDGLGLWKMLYEQMKSEAVKSQAAGAEEDNAGTDSLQGLGGINFSAMR